MYTRPRFLEELHAIREEMSRECDYDMDLFAALIRNSPPPQRLTVPAEQDTTLAAAENNPHLKNSAPRKSKRR